MTTVGASTPVGSSIVACASADTTDDELLELCQRAADAVHGALATVADWSSAGERPGQYAIDLVADRAVLDVLARAGLDVLSEESGMRRTGSELLAVVDPVDGSTNASRGLGWYATSICVVDGDGPRVAVVANQASGVRYHAVRGGGAWRDGAPIHPSGCRRIGEAVVAVNGYPERHLGWSQFRALAAAALDLCCVADGTLDAFTVVGRAHLAPWDYSGGLLVCAEAGAAVDGLADLAPGTLSHGIRRSVAAAATPELLDQLHSNLAGTAGR